MLQASNFVEQISTGPTALTYAIWISLLLSAIGIFYGLVFAASGGLSEFLKDKVTFTRKDFVPYSERRKCVPLNMTRSRSQPKNKLVSNNISEEPLMLQPVHTLVPYYTVNCFLFPPIRKFQARGSFHQVLVQFSGYILKAVGYQIF